MPKRSPEECVLVHVDFDRALRALTDPVAIDLANGLDLRHQTGLAATRTGTLAAVDDVECPPLRDRSSTEGMDDLALKGSCASSNYVFILMARIAREQIDRERSA